MTKEFILDIDDYKDNIEVLSNINSLVIIITSLIINYLIV